LVSAAAAPGDIIGQLYAGGDTELTRFHPVNGETPSMLHEPLKKIVFETPLDFYWFKDGFFEVTETRYGLFENDFFE
jgi:hypothetical protein